MTPTPQARADLLRRLADLERERVLADGDDLARVLARYVAAMEQQPESRPEAA